MKLFIEFCNRLLVTVDQFSKSLVIICRTRLLSLKSKKNPIVQKPKNTAARTSRRCGWTTWRPRALGAGAALAETISAALPCTGATSWD